jgi:hypothetical protein
MGTAMTIRKSKVIELGGIKYKVIGDDLMEEDVASILRRNAAHVQFLIDQLETIKKIVCVIGGIDLRGKPIEGKLLSVDISNDISQFKEGIDSLESVRKFLAKRKAKIIGQITKL